MNLPNKLTLIAISLISVSTLLLASNWPAGYLTMLGTKVLLSWFIALMFSIVALLTDLLDGVMLRRKHLVTNFGKLLDPLADKLLVLTLFLSLTAAGQISAWGTAIILWRELAVTGC